MHDFLCLRCFPQLFNTKRPRKSREVHVESALQGPSISVTSLMRRLGKEIDPRWILKLPPIPGTNKSNHEHLQSWMILITNIFGQKSGLNPHWIYQLSSSINHVLLVKIDGPVWHTIYHQVPVAKGVPKPIKQPKSSDSPRSCSRKNPGISEPSCHRH